MPTINKITIEKFDSAAIKMGDGGTQILSPAFRAEHKGHAYIGRSRDDVLKQIKESEDADN